MAKVKQVHACRACGAELKAKDQIVCHVCHAVINYEDSKSPYATPDYLYFQFKDRNAELNPKDRGYKESKEKLEQQLVEYFRNCPEEDKTAALYDAFFHLKHILLSTCKPETIKSAVKLGKRIGEISNSVENYIKSQGAINVIRTIDPAGTEDGGEGTGNS